MSLPERRIATAIIRAILRGIMSLSERAEVLQCHGPGYVFIEASPPKDDAVLSAGALYTNEFTL